MSAGTGSGRRLQAYAAIWILLAPLIFLMAAISTVRSETVYNVQLAAFSIAAVASLVFGVAGLFRRAWAAVGLLLLSSLGAVYFFGTALLILLWPIAPGSEAEFEPLLLVVPLTIAPFGVPFLLMARSLRSLTKHVYVRADAS